MVWQQTRWTAVSGEGTIIRFFGQDCTSDSHQYHIYTTWLVISGKHRRCTEQPLVLPSCDALDEHGHAPSGQAMMQARQCCWLIAWNYPPLASQGIWKFWEVWVSVDSEAFLEEFLGGDLGGFGVLLKAGAEKGDGLWLRFHSPNHISKRNQHIPGIQWLGASRVTTNHRCFQRLWDHLLLTRCHVADLSITLHPSSIHPWLHSHNPSSVSYPAQIRFDCHSSTVIGCLERLVCNLGLSKAHGGADAQYSLGVCWHALRNESSWEPVATTMLRLIWRHARAMNIWGCRECLAIRVDASFPWWTSWHLLRFTSGTSKARPNKKSTSTKQKQA